MSRIIKPIFEQTFDTYVKSRYLDVKLIDDRIYDKDKISGIQAGFVTHSVDYKGNSIGGLFIVSKSGSNVVIVW